MDADIRNKTIKSNRIPSWGLNEGWSGVGIISVIYTEGKKEIAFWMVGYKENWFSVSSTRVNGIWDFHAGEKCCHIIILDCTEKNFSKSNLRYLCKKTETIWDL